MRGELISLKDLRYTDLPTIEGLREAQLQRIRAGNCQRTVDFLLQPDALAPYEKKV